MSILTGECKVKKILDANSDVLGDLTGVKATSTTPFSFFGEGSKLAGYSISGASGGVGDNRNLFDKDNADLAALYPDQSTGTVTDGSGAGAYSLIIPVPASGGSFIFRLDSPYDDPVANRLRCACYSTYPYAGTVALSVDETSARSGDLLYNAFYAPEGTAYVMVFLWSGSRYTSEVINSAIMNNNLMLERGTGLNLSEYAAYGECYDIPIAVKGKNEIINTIATQTRNGLTITRNDDGSITINGTATANTNFVLTQDTQTFNVADYQEIDRQRYILSGSPASGAVNKYLMSFKYCSAAGSASSFARVPAGGSAVIDNTSGDHCLIAPYITVWNGITCNNVVFRPMLGLEGTSDTYEAPFNSTARLSLDSPLGTNDTITLEDTNIDIPICNGLNTITFQTSVQPSEITIYTNESGTKKTGKIMDASNHTLIDLFPFMNTHKVSYYSQDGNTLISREYVPHGNNAAGNVTTSKESSAQYNYIFMGWNTLINQTIATENVLQNITSDKNVYAAFSETARTYTTYFYNGETLLEAVTGVPYGGTATYTGATPTKSGYVFAGWLPAPINISSDTSCYAQFE